MKRLRNMLVLLLAICMLITAVLSSTVMAAEGEFQQRGDYWYYYDENGEIYEGWLNYDDSWYYFIPFPYPESGLKDGAMARGALVSTPEGDFIFADSGKVIIDPGWTYITVNGEQRWYYVTSNGRIVRGWVNDNNAWYFIKETGVVWGKIVDTDYVGFCYFENDGKLSTRTGWYQLPFWHDSFIGVPVDNSYYYLENGICKEGWLNYNGNWYYLQPQLVNNTCLGGFDENFQLIEDVFVGNQFGPQGNYYLFGPDCALITSPGWHQIRGEWYYVKEDATVDYGWKTLDGKWYYLSPSLIVNGSCIYNDVCYFFEDCVCRGYIKDFMGKGEPEKVYFN